MSKLTGVHADEIGEEESFRAHEEDVEVLMLPVRLCINDKAAGCDSIDSRMFEVAGTPSYVRMDINLAGYRDKTTGKISYRINRGDWHVVDKTYEQFCVGVSTGPDCTSTFMRNTVRLHVPAVEIAQGTNTVEWRINYKDLELRGGGSGARIVVFDVMDIDGESVMTTSVQRQSKAAWRTYGGDPAAGHVAAQACYACHVDDGQMWVDFGVTEADIISQALKNGSVTEQAARDIAAMVTHRRAEKLDALNAKYPSLGLTLDDLAETWDPPMQPGPPMATNPTELFGQGAGYKWVAPDEGVTYAYTQRQIDQFDHDGFLNLNTIPRPTQWEGWQSWVPTVDVSGICDEAPAYVDAVLKFMTATSARQMERRTKAALRLFRGPIRGTCFSDAREHESPVEHEAKNKIAALAMFEAANRVGWDNIARWYPGFEWDRTGFLESGWGPIFFRATHKSATNDIGANTCWVYPGGVLPRSAKNCSSSPRGSWQSFLLYSEQAHFGFTDTKPYGDPGVVYLHGFKPYDAKYAYGFLNGHQRDTGVGRGVQAVLESTRLQQANNFQWSERAWKERHTNPYPAVRAVHNGGLAALASDEIADMFEEHVRARNESLYRFWGCTGEGLGITCSFAGVDRGTANDELQPPVTVADCRVPDAGNNFKKDTCYFGLESLKIMQEYGSDTSVRQQLAGLYSAAFPAVASEFARFVDGVEAPEPSLRRLWTPGEWWLVSN